MAKAMAKAMELAKERAQALAAGRPRVRVCWATAGIGPHWQSWQSWRGDMAPDYSEWAVDVWTGDDVLVRALARALAVLADCSVWALAAALVLAERADCIGGTDEALARAVAEDCSGLVVVRVLAELVDCSGLVVVRALAELVDCSGLVVVRALEELVDCNGQAVAGVQAPVVEAVAEACCNSCRIRYLMDPDSDLEPGLAVVVWACCCCCCCYYCSCYCCCCYYSYSIRVGVVVVVVELVALAELRSVCCFVR